MCVYPFGVAAVDSLLFKTSAAEIVSKKPQRKGQQKSTEQLAATRTNSTSNTPSSNFYWSNSDSLCWLDSVMTVLVNNRCLKLCLEKYQPKDSILQHLCENFNEAQMLGPKEQGKKILQTIRMKVFEYLKTKMQCSLGVNDSALESLNALLKDSSVIRERFIQECVWTFRCSSCGYTQVDRHQKLVVTFPNTTDDFNMPSGVFQRACYKCKVVGQKSQLDIKRLPPCVMAHFVEGVKNKDFFKQDFVCQGNNYELCQLIQYKRNPDHFVAWIRNSNGTHWAKVDDTENVVCQWRKGLPSFPLDQVYIAVWERTKLYQRKSSSVENAVKSSTETKRLVSQRKCAKDTSTLPQALSENLNEGKANSFQAKDQLVDEPQSRSGLLVDKRRNSDSENVAEEICNSAKTMEVNAEDITNKRKSNAFEPYIPKKKRALGEEQSKTCHEHFTQPTRSDKCAEDKTMTNFSQWKSRAIVEKEKQGVVCDNQSDSGYSSPGSNSSCVSLPGQCSKEEHLILNEIMDTLDEIGLTGSRNVEGIQKVDSLNLKSLKTEPLTVPVSAGSNLPYSQNEAKETSLANVELPDYMMNLDWCPEPIKDVSFCKNSTRVNDLDLSANLDPSFDFPDIDTFSNCGNDIFEELNAINFEPREEPSGSHSDHKINLDCIDLTNPGQSSSALESPVPHSEDTNNTVGLPGSTKSSNCEAENQTSYMQQNKCVLSDLQRTMKSVIYTSKSEYQAKLEKTESTTGCSQNTAPFLHRTELLNCETESVTHVDASFPEGQEELHNSLRVQSSPIEQKAPRQSANEESCNFPSLDLPDITEFIELQGNLNNYSSTSATDQNSSFQDILEQIFPSKLLEKDTCEKNSTFERTDIAAKNTGFVLELDDA